MLVSEIFSKYFNSHIRKRGEEYFILGQVRIDERFSDSIYATVRGTQSYQVAVILKGNLSFGCTCPYFEETGPCKHLWAVILQIDSDSRPDAQPALFESSLPTVSAEKKQQPSWEHHFKRLSSHIDHELSLLYTKNRWPQEREIIYVINMSDNFRSKNGLLVSIGWRQKKKNGDWSKIKTQKITIDQVANMSNQNDRKIMSLLMGARDASLSYYYYYEDRAVYPCVNLSEPPQIDLILPLMCETGRCFFTGINQDDDLYPLVWDDKRWEFWLDIQHDETGNHYVLEGMLCGEDERMSINEPIIFVKSNIVIWQGRIARFNDFGASNWITLFQEKPQIHIPVNEKDKLLEELFNIPRLPEIKLPEELRCKKIVISPKPRLHIVNLDKENIFQNYSDHLHAKLSFAYGKEIITAADYRKQIFSINDRQLIIRDDQFEENAINTLTQLGFARIQDYYAGELRLKISRKKFPKVVPQLIAMDWHVEAEGKLYHQPGSFDLNVVTEIDWFELHGSVEFGNQKATLPELLSALKKGENMVQLEDGSFGMLPENWLKKYGLIAGLGETKGEHLRFSRAQVCLLDALLAAQPEVKYDEAFNTVRNELKQFDGVKSVSPPKSFRGELRQYQTEGLGWLKFLQQFRFGGCLADDMGLGKTVQVLALLESRRQENNKADTEKTKEKDHQGYPSLVVVPKSLIFNWQHEAARFTPQVKILDHSGGNRLKPGKHFSDYDIVLTTYGILRRDILHMKDLKFDYCILDEAQTIKNAKTGTAKAVRLINCQHRLALSGTPVENHLGELGSLFEFLNPGLLGSSSILGSSNSWVRNPEKETLDMLARGLRPFILRRTKGQVAKDLPPKTEQTIFCELGGKQERLYKELLNHYRTSLLNRVQQQGINKSKMFVLEALLRLRQAACHPGLIDKSKINESSAKLDAVIPQLLEVIEEGHKGLVFSQFTSFLSIIRHHLDIHGITYEYLDGKTRNRASKVERFQNDPDCSLFLISLKAGGLGLNLTAAEYVFLLDPWWNPAVEAQAIDRTHRIGQGRHVFAYRLIAKDTIEEKVLELQKQKRELADAIINADNSLIRNLSREDLELLLS